MLANNSIRTIALIAVLVCTALLAALLIMEPSPAPAPCPPCPEPEPCPEVQSEPCPELPAHLRSRLSRIEKRGVLRVGVRSDTIPFGFYSENDGSLVGFEPDIARAVAKELGVDVKLVAVSAATRIPMLHEGRIDLIAAVLTHHVSREDNLDFSITYFMDGQKILVRRSSGIKSAADLSGRKVAVAKGTWAESNMMEAQPGARIESYNGYPQAFVALKRGRVSAVSADATILLGLKNSDTSPGIWAIEGGYITNGPIAFGLPEDDSDYRDAVNIALQRVWLNGGYMRIYNRWFGPHTKYYLPTTWRMEVWQGVDKN